MIMIICDKKIIGMNIPPSDYKEINEKELKPKVVYRKTVNIWSIHYHFIFLLNISSYKFA